MRRKKLPLASLMAWLLVCGDQPAGAQAPGSTNITIRNPDPAKWTGSSIFRGSTGEFNCRPLACSDPARVTASMSESPTRDPDPKALAKLVSAIPESLVRANTKLTAAGRKLELLSSGTTTLRAYPAIVKELRMADKTGPVYLCEARMFIKFVQLSISSYSSSLELARRNRDLFIKAMVVEHTPGPR